MRKKALLCISTLIACILLSSITAFAKNEPSTRMVCPRQCGGSMKLLERTLLDSNVTCEKYPNDNSKKDKLFLYVYECNSCSTVDETAMFNCTHYS